MVCLLGLLCLPPLALAAVSATTKTLTTTMLGSNEVLKGAPKGSGKAVITLNAGTRKVCWTFSNVKGISKVNAAHIPQSAKGQGWQRRRRLLRWWLEDEGLCQGSEVRNHRHREAPHRLLRQHPHEQISGWSDPRLAIDITRFRFPEGGRATCGVSPWSARMHTRATAAAVSRADELGASHVGACLA